MSKIEKAAREVISLMSEPGSCSYNEENKRRFHAAARVVLKHLAEKHLGLTKSAYDLRGNLAGIAVSGEVTLHTDRIYLQLGESCLGPKFMWRTCASRKDYHGGPNQWLPYDALRDLTRVGMILLDATDPCKGAVQIGSTSDLRAVWRKNDRLFLVFYDAQDRTQVEYVGEDVIHRPCVPPIPWESFKTSDANGN